MRRGRRQNPMSDSIQRAARANPGLVCLMVIAAVHQIPVDEERLLHDYGTEALDLARLRLAALGLGLKSRVIRLDARRVRGTPAPFVCQLDATSFFIVQSVRLDETTGVLTAQIHAPGAQASEVPLAELVKACGGRALIFAPAHTGRDLSFGLRWFLPTLVKYRRIFGELLIVSAVLQAIGLATPIFFQVVTDKVLVNDAMSTLDVMAIGLLVCVTFQVLLTTIRAYTMAHTGSRIDVELGSRLFRHLLSLPVDYFRRRRAGDSVARVRELENVRHFLTDGALTLVIDVVFALLFLAVLFWYSPKLTVVVLLTVPIYVTVALVFTPVILGRLEHKFNRGAENQAYLIEAVSGVSTIKSLALEPRWTQTWDQQLTRFVFASLSVIKAGNLANALVQLTSQLTTVTILWVGAGMVIQRQLTVGELVAFNMLAGQVTGPILRLSGLWNEFQQFRVSMDRLGDIFTTLPEVQERSFRMPRLQGRIELRGLHFRYPGQSRDALSEVELAVQPGEVVAVVGRSGSGKSTLASLLLGLYMPNQGRLLIDGTDITSVDTASLRSQVGVVPQECTLFSGTIRSNIALADPLAPIERIIRAAQLAGAHEFIAELALGYETPIGENGTGLSGGQRQRLAIARALVTDPAILILDEATSALDQESERAIHANMHDIVKGRTVIVIAHRESAIRIAKRVILLEHGKVVEDGPLDRLRHNPASAYARLFGSAVHAEVAA